VTQGTGARGRAEGSNPFLYKIRNVEIHICCGENICVQKCVKGPPNVVLPLQKPPPPLKPEQNLAYASGPSTRMPMPSLEL